jgi:hypothetical protein
LSSLRDRKKADLNQVLKELSSLPGVTELALFADKSANQGNLLFSGRYQGRECFIKYSSLSDDGVRNEYKMGRYFYKLLAKHVPEMYRFIKIEAQGAACIMEKCTGVTLTEYIRNKRLHHAAHLLRTTNLQVQTIATHCGITDLQYFSKLFKKETGKTPKEYRKSVQR